MELEDEKLHEKCGVVGIYLNKPVQNASENGTISESFVPASDVPAYNAAKLAYYGLYSLQHRGQESAGIAVSDGEKINQYKAMGLVADVFKANKLEELGGKIAVGHVLYSTSGAAHIENAQPFVNRFKLGGIAVAHNGQLVNFEQLKEFLEETGSTFTSTSDTEVIIKLIAKSYKKGLEKALTDTIQMIKGSFALCVMTENSLIGARDPN